MWKLRERHGVRGRRVESKAQVLAQARSPVVEFKIILLGDFKIAKIKFHFTKDNQTQWTLIWDKALLPYSVYWQNKMNYALDFFSRFLHDYWLTVTMVGQIVGILVSIPKKFIGDVGLQVRSDYVAYCVIICNGVKAAYKAVIMTHTRWSRPVAFKGFMLAWI